MTEGCVQKNKNKNMPGFGPKKIQHSVHIPSFPKISMSCKWGEFQLCEPWSMINSSLGHHGSLKKFTSIKTNFPWISWICISIELGSFVTFFALYFFSLVDFPPGITFLVWITPVSAFCWWQSLCLKNHPRCLRSGERCCLGIGDGPSGEDALLFTAVGQPWGLCWPHQTLGTTPYSSLPSW